MESVVQRLRGTAATRPAQRVSMQTLARAHGPAAHGAWLALMAVPCLLPVPGFGTVLGRALAAPTMAMWRGRTAACRPRRVAELECSSHWAQRALDSACVRLGGDRAIRQGPAQPPCLRGRTVLDRRRPGADCPHRRDAAPLRQRAPGTCADAHRAGTGVSRWCCGCPGTGNRGPGGVRLHGRHCGRHADGLGLGQWVAPGLVLDVNKGSK